MMGALSPKGPAVAADPASDERIVEEVRKGDAGRFEVLMRRHNQRLFRAARAILRDDAEAEDAVQQAYVAAYVKIDQFRGESRFSTWLTRIAVHEALRRVRKQGRLRDLALVEDAEAGSLALPPERSPEDRAAQTELRALLEEAIDTLPEAYRVVFVMRDVEELSTRETADCLELTEEAVRVRLHRARRSLREWLYERTDTLTADAFHFAGARCDRIVAAVLQAISSL